MEDGGVGAAVEGEEFGFAGELSILQSVRKGDAGRFARLVRLQIGLSSQA